MVFQGRREKRHREVPSADQRMEYVPVGSGEIVHDFYSPETPSHPRISADYRFVCHIDVVGGRTFAKSGDRIE